MGVLGSDVGALHQVHAIVMGSKHKKYPIEPQMHIGTLSEVSIDAAVRTWIERLMSDTGPLVPAQDLYTGERWAVARSLPTLTGSAETLRIWVCSPGYGLIPADAPLRPYAATFAPGYADSIPGGPEESNQWWRALSRWEGPSPGSPRSITALAEADASATFLLALSEPYLKACRDDITAGVAAVTESENFLIISTGARRSGSLTSLIVPTDARLQSQLGGTRQGLNIRILAHLLTSEIRTRAEARDHLERLLAGQPSLPRYQRRKLSDQEVASFINEALSRSPGASASQLLRQFRDAGYACEQHRFGEIYRSLPHVRS